MKFKTLEIKNIASIEYATINFEDPILANESLFLIYGETGSGKTTILDSICLALYKTTPRIKQSKGDKYQDDELRTGKDATEISITDIRQYLRRGASEGFAQLTFCGNDSKDYTARIQFGKTRNGTLKNVEWSLASDHDLIVSDDDRFRKTILRVIGLDYEQFCRTTMLAQGEFTKFLKSETKDKTAILEKVTGTEIYSRIGSEIYCRAKAKEDEISDLKKELEYLSVLSQEELDSLVDEKNRLAAEIVKLDVQKAELDRQKNWLKQMSEFEESLKANKQKLDLNNDLKQAPQYVQNKKLVDDYKNTETARQSLARVAELASEQQRFLDSRKSYYESYQRLTNGDLYRAMQLEEKRRQFDEVESFITKQSANAEMFENSQTIVAQLQNCIKDGNDAVMAQRKAEEKEKSDLPVLDAEASRLKAESERISAEKQRLQSLIFGKQKEYEAIGYSNVQSLYANINEQLATITDAISKIDTYEKATKEYNGYLEATEKLKTNISINEKRQSQLAEQLSVAVDLAKKSENLYNSMKLSVGDYARSLRAELHVGDKCPVCGQTIKELVTDEALEKTLRPLLDDLNGKREKAETAEAEHNAVLTEVKAQKMQLETAERTVAQYRETLEKSKAEFEAVCLSVGIEADDNAKESALSLQEKCKKQQSELSKKISEGESLHNAINDLNREKDKAVSEAENIGAQMSSNSERKSKCKADIENLKENSRQSRQKSEDALKSVSSKIKYADWADNIESTIARLQIDAKEYSDKCQRKAELANLLDSEMKAMKQTAVTREQVEAMFTDWKPGTTPTQIDELDGKWTYCLQESSKLIESISRNNKQKIAEEQKVKNLLLSIGVSNDRLTELAQTSDCQIAEAERYYTQIDKSIAEANGALTNAKEMLDRHLQTKPKIEKNLTEILSCIEECEASVSNGNKRIGEIGNKLKANEDNIRKRADRDKVIRQLEEDFKNWEHLDKLFGDKEGKKFRTIAQSFILKELLVKANYYLNQLSDRYELDCQNNSLVILVRDMYLGGKMRPVDLMSGGESFVVSLALALGLSNLNSNGFTTDMLFIDEGFGTLDSNTLETVMNTLEHLRETGNRKVGIISHVDALYERISAKICVERTGGNAGTISLARN